LKAGKAIVRAAALAAAGGPGAWLLRLLGATGRVSVKGLPRTRDWRLQNGVIYAFWHEHLLNITAYFGTRCAGLGLTILIGHHLDGEIIARIVRGLRMETVRGSKTRGGMAAVEGLLRVLKEGRSIVFTPDGPRGPRRTAKDGVIVLAQRAGVPIVPITAVARPSVHAGSWDRMELPFPFSRVRAAEGEPIRVSPGAGAAEREKARARLEQELNSLADRAEEEFR